MAFKVKIRHACLGEIELDNITEIHWCYPSTLESKSVALKSDIDGTGCTYFVKDIVGFEAHDSEHGGLGWNGNWRGISYAAHDDMLLSLEEEIVKLRAALNPRYWSKEMIGAWHKHLPDTQLAFDMLRQAAIRKNAVYDDATSIKIQHGKIK